MYEYLGTVTSVTDADTMHIELDLGCNVSTKIIGRLARINAYEKTLRYGQTQEQKELGLAGMAYVEENYLGKQCIIKTEKDKKGSFGRYIVEIVLNEENLSDQLVKLGYAIYQDY